MLNVFKFEMTGRTIEHMQAALAYLKAIDGDRPKPSIVGWTLHASGMNLCWSKSAKGFIPFPSPLTYSQLGPTLMSWIQQAEYPDAPDIDGSIERGFRIKANQIGYDYADFTCEPFWVEYHK